MRDQKEKGRRGKEKEKEREARKGSNPCIPPLQMVVRFVSLGTIRRRDAKEDATGSTLAGSA